jgi:transcriptional regulator with XRE-family HTH domain
MYSDALVQRVRRLLEQGNLSQRAVARKLGLSHGVINRIAKGFRPSRRQTTTYFRLSPNHLLGEPVRCRGCGGLVYQPCLLCRARAHKRQLQEARRRRALDLVNRSNPRRVA